MEEAITIGVIFSASIPFVISIMSAFSRATRVTGIEGYFVFDKQLDTDGFIKTTIGYSLQVAAIVLLFYWTVEFGIAAPLIVCAAWAGGYYLLARAVRRGLLDQFLGVGSANGSQGNETIHGYIGTHLGTTSRTKRDVAVGAVAFASVVGLGGTMMAEVDYTSIYFVSALDLNMESTARIGIVSILLLFTVLYVLWGGYKSAVFTDRFQVPLAYVAFSVFGFGLTVLSNARSSESAIGWIMALMLLLLGALLFRRLRTISSIKNETSSLLIMTLFTFLPVILIGTFALFAISNYASSSPWSLAKLAEVSFPATETLFGLGLWGLVALVFANGVWQFVDISSLQRLQSITHTEDIIEQQADGEAEDTAASSDSVADKERIARTLQWAGVEAGLGWALIALTGLIIRSSGFRASDFIPGLLESTDWRAGALVCVFTFTVIVYMLSTISGFISAISYVSYYDFLPMLGNNVQTENASSRRLTVARITSILAIGSIFFLYSMLRLVKDDIAAILYAIYAFQIVILPSALVAIFMPISNRIPLYAGAVVPSVIVGMISAFYAAVTPAGWEWFSMVGVNASSWAVFPPLFSAFVATVTFAILTITLKFFARRRTSV